MARKIMISTSTGPSPAEERFFVDTSAWIAIIYTGDKYHAAAVDYYRDLRNRRSRLYTSDAVLSETLTRLRYDRGHAVAMTFYQQIEETIVAGRLAVLHVSEEIWQAGLDIFRKYDDQVFSFTDCTSFALCQTHHLSHAFAFDHHFFFFGVVVEPAT
jgi:predicted nucleic acid-binding protein